MLNSPEQKFFEAVNCLITEGNLSRRLERATCVLLLLQDEDFVDSESSEELKLRLGFLKKRLSTVGKIVNEGSIRATIRLMTEQEQTEASKDILSLYRAVMGVK